MRGLQGALSAQLEAAKSHDHLRVPNFYRKGGLLSFVGGEKQAGSDKKVQHVKCIRMPWVVI